MSKKSFVGLYHNETDLITKIEELKAEGFSNDNIYVVARDEKDISMVKGRTGAEIQTTNTPTHGSWMDRFKSYLTGEEPIRGAFHNMGIPEHEAKRYNQDIENGGMLLYVDEGEYSRLHGHPHLDHQATGHLNPVDDQEHLNDEERIRLHEERVNVNKERVQTGEVSVEKNVHIEEQVVDVPVSHEEVYIERHAVVGGELNPTDIKFDKDAETIHIPITEERVEVTKKPVVTEEIVIGKRDVEEIQTIKETVRKEEAHVKREGRAKTDAGLLDNDLSKKNNKRI